MSPPHNSVEIPIPVSAGIGLKTQHFDEIIADKPPLGWFEVHMENYMGEGGVLHHYLERIRQDYPLSGHGVGLSLGSSDRLDQEHLQRIKTFIDRYQPALVSEHVSFSTVGGHYLNDLLPLPYTDESLKVVVNNVNEMQDFLGRQVLVENPSTYLQFKSSNNPQSGHDNAWLAEVQFLNDLAKETGCGLLLDINNVFVSCMNHNWSMHDYIRRINGQAVQEYHLAGHTEKKWRDQTIRIDDHGANVSYDVWELYDFTLDMIGERPVLIEWDTNVPSLLTLVQEAQRAEYYMQAKNNRSLARSLERDSYGAA